MIPELLHTPEVHFFLVGLSTHSRALGLERVVRNGATPNDADPWVRVPGQMGRSRDVQRFWSKGEAEAWAKARLRLKGTKCRVVPCRGPVIG